MPASAGPVALWRGVLVVGFLGFLACGSELLMALRRPRMLMKIAYFHGNDICFGGSE